MPSYSKTLFSKDCSLSSERDREREGGRGRERETERQRETEEEKENSNTNTLILKESSVRSILTYLRLQPVLQTQISTTILQTDILSTNKQ